MHQKFINAVLFQALWFAAVLSGWLLALVPLLVLLLHLVSVQPDKRELLPWLFLACLGMTGDSILSVSGVYSFPNETSQVAGLLPFWLSFMWLGFAATLPLSLSWIFKSPWLLLVIFTLGGPLSYSAGRALGALSFANQDAIYVVGLWFLIGLCALGVSKFSTLRTVASVR